MKHVGLIGYFGAGAFSDDLIEHVTKQLFTKFRGDLAFDGNVLKKCMAGVDVKYLNSFDLLVHCGGSLLGKCTHPPISSIESWAGKLKVPFAVFGLGYRMEPDKEPLTEQQRNRIKVMFDSAQIISLRGPRTEYWLHKNGVSTSKVCSLADPVIACEWNLQMEPRFIGGNVRDMPSNEIQHSTTERVQKFMAECYDSLIDHYRLPLHLFSFRHNSVNDNDITGARKVQALMKHHDYVRILLPNSYQEAFDCMRKTVFWFGQRLHPSIFAAAHGIPFIGLEYQFEKMMDYMASLGSQNYIHVTDASADKFISKFIDEGWLRIGEAMAAKRLEIEATAEKIVGLL